MGVLLLGPEDHKGLMTFGQGVALMRAGFEDFAHSPVRLSNPRTRTNTPDGLRMTVHQGVTPSKGGAVTTARAEKVQVLPDGRQKYPGRGRPVFVVYDSHTAELLMVMIGEPRPKGFEQYNAIAGFHTACAAIAGTNIVARPDAERVGVLGSGGQAVMHLAALASTRPVSEVLVYSPTPEHREAFAADMSESLGVPVHAVGSNREVLEHAEILLVCTNSNKPVLDGRDLQPGTHITSIVHSNKEMLQAGLIDRMRQEIDDETLRRADIIVTSNKVQEELDQPEVLYGAAQRGVIDWDSIVELGDILNGRVDLQPIYRRRGITFFKNPAAWGIGAGAFFRGMYDLARQAGVGRDLTDISGFEPSY